MGEERREQTNSSGSGRYRRDRCFPERIASHIFSMANDLSGPCFPNLSAGRHQTKMGGCFSPREMFHQSLDKVEGVEEYEKRRK